MLSGFTLYSEKEGEWFINDMQGKHVHGPFATLVKAIQKLEKVVG